MGNQRSCFHICLAFILKFLNYLQTFLGVSIIVYSCFMLSHWRHHHLRHVPAIPTSLSPSAPSPFYFSNPDSIILLPYDVTPLRLDHSDYAVDFAELDLTLHDGLQTKFPPLPTPWFIYAFMGVGITLCLVTFIGHVAAEAINGCCLCFYTLLTTIFILFEASLVAFIALDHQWEKDLPADPTGELDNLCAFIKKHMDVCEWVGIAVIIIQVLTLLLSIILRALVNQKVELDDDSVHGTSGRPWEPILHTPETRGGHSDIWSNRIREKYGLDGSGGKENQHV